MTKTNAERNTETLIEFADAHRSQMRQIGEKIDALTSQVGVLSENLTRLEIQVERIANISERQAATAESQAESVRQLIALLNRKAN
ncbi:MAG: hypothetical protein HC769_31520 [Cyanobacteria bacterium CRU_2_1]|nr:hypothetical protein [Cyanobacteria bacterium CRU_2_1]